MAEAGKLQAFPGIIVQGRYDFLCPPSTSHALAAVWPNAEVRIVEGAGHSLYDPGVRDAVMKAIADIASKDGRIRKFANASGRKGNAADLDGHRSRRRARIQSLVRWRASRGARRDRRFSRGAALRRACSQPEIPLPLFHRNLWVLDSPAYRTVLANPTAWSKTTMARFKNMIRAVARITISRGQGRGAALGVVRLRPSAESKERCARC